MIIKLTAKKYHVPNTTNLIINAGDLIGKSPKELKELQKEVEEAYETYFARQNPADVIVQILNSPVSKLDKDGNPVKNNAGQIVTERLSMSEQARIFRILDKIEEVYSKDGEMSIELSVNDMKYMTKRVLEFLDQVHLPRRIYVYLYEVFSEIEKTLKEE
ncbi:MAG: hypothetical protein ACP5E3_19420 [Bacteroidales bacterium]